jgi:hypothetical protein
MARIKLVAGRLFVSRYALEHVHTTTNRLHRLYPHPYHLLMGLIPVVREEVRYFCHDGGDEDRQGKVPTRLHRSIHPYDKARQILRMTRGIPLTACEGPDEVIPSSDADRLVSHHPIWPI